MQTIDHGKLHMPSEIFDSLRIATASGNVVYEGVQDADWRLLAMGYSLLIFPPDMDDAGVQQDAGH